MKVEIETEATQFLEQENVNGIFVAVWQLVGTVSREFFFKPHFFLYECYGFNNYWLPFYGEIKFKVFACFYEKTYYF